MICFIDMDGVIADFVVGACRAHNRPSPYGDPKSLGVFDIEKLWGMTPSEFWLPCDGERFWDDLPKTVEADGIMALALETFGLENVAVLTTPSMSPYCVPGKRRWIRRHFPELAKSMIFSSAKRFLGGPGRVLIDDRDRNIEEFSGYGGHGVMVPRPWNKMHGYCESVIDKIRETLSSVTGTPI